MKIACIIPTYNFLEGVKRISHWITNEYHFLAAEQRIIIVDDGSDHRYAQDFERLNRLENFTVIKSRGRQSLREAILTGYDEVKDWNPDLINIIETDALPQTATLQAMIRVYKEAKGNVGSVSPIYTWDGENCYPTHKHWFSDSPTKENFSTGPVREPGECGVPFLFSIWNPILFELMRDKNLPNLASLDSEFGKKVHRAGYRHLRITNYTIEHWMRGRQSNAIILSKFNKK
jgi:hypothetical protein